MTDYIFGYGSLINSASRQLTGQTSQATPAVVNGLRRYWGKVDDSYILAPLVVTKGDGLVNGVLVAVDDDALKEFDQRERGYRRVAITPEHLSTELELKSTDQIWVYIIDSLEPPCAQTPIMQSYVDTVIAGCLEVSEAFATQFIEQTVGWHYAKQDDRHQPKYGNLAGVTPQHQVTIDRLLNQY